LEKSQVYLDFLIWFFINSR